MKYIHLLILILFLSACDNSLSKSYQTPDYVKMADRITAATAKKIELETGMRLIGEGGGMMYHIRMMAMSFDCYKEITMEQGRELLIYCVDEYLAAINANEEVRPYLIHYPFTTNDIQIEIYLRRPDRRDVPMGSLYVISVIDGQLVYKIRQPEPKILLRLHEEPYEEAVKILATEEPVDKVRRNTNIVQKNKSNPS